MSPSAVRGVGVSPMSIYLKFDDFSESLQLPRTLGALLAIVPSHQLTLFCHFRERKGHGQLN